jgi:hypothetical protein
MNKFDYLHTPRHLMLLIIAGSMMLFSAIASATETSAQQNLSGVEEARPGPLGLAVSGEVAGMTTEYFEQAVTDALVASEIFSSIDDSQPAEIILPMIRAKGSFHSNEDIESTPYYLSIRVIKVETPSFSMRMSVGMNAVWVLYHTVDKVELLHENIYSTYTGGWFEGGISGAKRVRIALEGATRESIRLGIEMLESINIEEDKNQGEESGSEHALPMK